MGLTDLLDRWLDVHDELGTNGRNGFTRGATDAELRRLEDLLGFELLPQVREMLSWATIDPSYRGYGGKLLPTFASSYLPLKDIPRNSIHPINDTPALDLYTIIGENYDHDPPSPDRMMVQLFHEPGWIWVDHGRGPTDGGLWEIDEAERWWVANGSRRVDRFVSANRRARLVNQRRRNHVSQLRTGEG